jgi:hypothetical protein
MPDFNQKHVNGDLSGSGVSVGFFGLVTVAALVPGIVGIFNGMSSKNAGQIFLGGLAIIGGLTAAWQTGKAAHTFLQESRSAKEGLERNSL